jgi:protein TonB
MPAQQRAPPPPRRKPKQQPPPNTEITAALAPIPAPLGTTSDAAGTGSATEGDAQGAIGDAPLTGPGDDYLDRLRRWINQYKHYPKEALDRKDEGHVVVRFMITRDGTVLDPMIEQSSGSALLDTAAVQMLRDASPVPPLPPVYRADRATIALPIEYSIGIFERLF